MKFFVLHRWSSESSRIKKYYSLKGEYLFGSGSECDVKVKTGAALGAKLNISRSEFDLLPTGEVRQVSKDELFQWAGEIFQWKETEISFKKYPQSILVLSALSVVVLILVFSVFVAGKSEVCSPRSVKLVSGKWKGPYRSPEEEAFFEALILSKKETQMAIAKKDWLRAKSEFLFLVRKSGSLEASCGESSEILKMGSSLSRGLIYFYLKNQNIIAAAEEWNTFSVSMRARLSEAVFRRLQKAIRAHYLRGYQREDQDPEAGDRTMEEALRACQILNLPHDCFRNSGRSEKVSSE